MNRDLIEAGFRVIVREAPHWSRSPLALLDRCFADDTVNPLTRELLNHYSEFEHLRDLPLGSVRLKFDQMSTSGSVHLPWADTAVLSSGRRSDQQAIKFTPARLLSDDCIIYIHGGGFVMGAISEKDQLCHRMAAVFRRPIVGLSYPLSPEHSFPDAVSSIEGQLNYLSQHGALGKRVDIIAESAGANLALNYCLNTSPIVTVLHLVLAYPFIDFDLSQPSVKQFAEGYFLSEDDLLWFRSCYVPTDVPYKDPTLSPLWSASLAIAPPTLVLSGRCDPLFDQGAALAEKLKNSGSQSDWITYGGMPHGFLRWPGIVSKSNEALRDVRRFLGRASSLS